MADNNETKWYGWGLANKEYNLTRRGNFWPYLTEKLRLEDIKTPPVNLQDIILPAPDPYGLASHLERVVGANNVRTDNLSRITHAMGKSYIDLIRIRRGIIENAPDIIVYPENEEQILAILLLATEAQAAIIPFGGGSSVVGGVEAIKLEHQSAAITLDLRNLNKVLNIDEVSMVATIEAGIFGPQLEKSLQERGYTLGHYPQSFEFSTLGGWLATRSAGQQSNKYGRIEDMVMSLSMVTVDSIISTLDVPASASGPSVKQLLVGSEGLYGIISKAKMRINRMPKARLYHGVLFKEFYFGVQAIRMMNQQGIVPAMARLSDESESEALIKMRAESESVFENTLMKAGKWYIQKRGYTGSNCVMILGFEESENAQRAMKAALEICKANDGMDMGSHPGESWYRERFELPYLRDTLLDRGIMIDTLETATTWSNLLEVYNQVKEAIADAVKTFNRQTPPLIFCHISHSYHDGASLYFTFIAKQVKGAEVAQWQAIKTAACNAILEAGATISHHHGVGRDHARWALKEHGKQASQALTQVKNVFDPAGILNPGKFL